MPALTRQQEAELRLQEGQKINHQILPKVRTNARRQQARGSTMITTSTVTSVQASDCTAKKPFRRRNCSSHHGWMKICHANITNMISEIDLASQEIDVARSTDHHTSAIAARPNDNTSKQSLLLFHHQHNKNTNIRPHDRRKSLSSSSPSSSLLLSISFTFVIVTLVNLIVLQPAQMVGLVAAISNQGSLAVTSQQQQQQQQQQSNSVIQMPPTLMTASGQQTPSVSTPTTSSVISSGKARYKTMYACEDRQLTMDCDYGSKINLIRANFGRFSITQCNEQGQLDLSTDCMSPITFRIMQERCQDRQKCSVNATSKLFGDRCPKTRKYLEVHFQCQPDPRALPAPSPYGEPDLPYERVDLRNHSSTLQLPATASVVVSQSAPATYPHVPSSIQASSPVLPPNNIGPHSSHQQSQQQQQQAYPSSSNNFLPTEDFGKWVNSEIMSYHDASNSEIVFNKLQDPNSTREPIIVTMRHTHIVNMSNPRCNLWDPVARLWTERGSQIIQTNQTHTICAFDQPTSYLLVMDRMTSPSLSSSSSMLQTSTSMISDSSNSMHQQKHQLQNPMPTQDMVPQFGSPIPDILENQPVVLVQQAPNRQQQQQQQSNSSNNKFFSLIGYLMAALFIVVLFMTIAFLASSLRNSSSSAGAAFKSLGNLASLSGAGASKCKHRRQDMAAGGPGSSLHSSNKDLLVINNSNGHQFLYAPASTTKISSSSSTHILSATLGGRSSNGQPTHHQGTLHRVQQQLYSGNGATLSSLSATGTQGNNYFYGLMGLNPPLFQQQQQQQQLFSQQQQQDHVNHQHQAQHQQLVGQSYSHQANKSTISTESANSSSSSGVESGSASMQQQQPSTQQACLVTTSSAGNDFNLLSNNQLAGYGQIHPQGFFATPIGANTNYHLQHHQQQQQQQQRPQPTLTLNAHYSTSGIAQPINMTAQNQQQVFHQRQFSGSNQMRDHIYETVEYEKPYMSRLLILGNNANDL